MRPLWPNGGSTGSSVDVSLTSGRRRPTSAGSGSGSGGGGRAEVYFADVEEVRPAPADACREDPAVYLTWEDVCVTASGAGSRATPARILEGISGHARPGEVLAIMGVEIMDIPYLHGDGIWIEYRIPNIDGIFYLYLEFVS